MNQFEKHKTYLEYIVSLIVNELLSFEKYNP
jgi:hypothetical protein